MWYAGAQDVGEHARIVRPLGTAYASDYGLSLEQVETSPAVIVSGSNRAELETKVVTSLAVGYLPEPGSLKSLELAAVSDLINVRMRGDRAPADVARALVAPGNRVVETTWRFAGSEPVKTVGIYGPDGRLLFDTLMSMPVIEIPVVRGHM
jgi:hypothetical protein